MVKRGSLINHGVALPMRAVEAHLGGTKTDSQCLCYLLQGRFQPTPLYGDVKYVEALIAPDTVNTLPRETLDAYRAHGEPELRIDKAVEQAPAVMNGLSDLGIDMHVIDDALANMSSFEPVQAADIQHESARGWRESALLGDIGCDGSGGI